MRTLVLLAVMAGVASSAACLAPRSRLHAIPAAPPESDPASRAEHGPGQESPPVTTFAPSAGPQRSPAAQGVNIRVNQDASGRDQNETSLAVNPLNPLNVIVGFNDTRTGTWAAGRAVSFDRGATFSDGVLPLGKYAKQSDPTIAFCGDGVALYGFMDYSRETEANRIVVSRSTDSGSTWLAPGTVAESPGPIFSDRPGIACAPAGGTYANRAYVAWTDINFLLATVSIRFAYSTNRGQSWTGFKTLTTAADVLGTCVVPGPGGLIYVFWSGPTGIEFAKSVNGGGSWTTAATVSPVTAVPNAGYRRNSWPAAGIDASGGPRNGTVYVGWADARNGDVDVLVARSTDGGSTWGAPLRVNDDAVGNGRDQFFPALAVDGSGQVHVSWFDQRRDASGGRYEIYIATSRDGAGTFDVNRQVSDIASNGALTTFLGDYTGLAVSGSTLLPLWTDMRAGTGEEDVYLDRTTSYPYDSVTHVAFADAETLAFDDQEPRVGSAIVYDVASGDVGELYGASPWAAATCVIEDLAAPPAVVPGIPPAGHATWYLVRAQGSRGSGSWGPGSGHPDSRAGLEATSPCH